MDEIKKMTEDVVKTFENYKNQGTKPWNYETAIQDLSYQVGSLNKAFLQMKGYRHKGNLSDKDIKENLTDELADILSLVLIIAHELDINLKEAWRKMLASDKRKIDERSNNS